jgi:excisionase family DNA binding protein
MNRNEVTPVEAAKMLGVGRLYLYELLASGRIKGRKVLGRWLLSKQAVEAYRQERRPKEQRKTSGIPSAAVDQWRKRKTNREHTA